MILRSLGIQKALGGLGTYVLAFLGLFATGWIALARSKRAGRREQRLQDKLKQQELEIKAHEKYGLIRDELRTDDDVVERLRRNGL